MSYAPPSLSVDLHEDGLLWAINRVLFHPRGFALAHNPDGSFVLLGDGSEPWQFGDGIDDPKFAAFEDVISRAKSGGDT